MSQSEVDFATLEHLKVMSIPLGTTYPNSVDIGINTITRNWVSFIKLHRQEHERDGLALHKVERPFIMKLAGCERVIGKK